MAKGSVLMSHHFVVVSGWSPLVTDGTTNLLLGNHTNMLQVYQDVTLKWAAQLSFVPVAIRVANFPWVPPSKKHLMNQMYLWGNKGLLKHSGGKAVILRTTATIRKGLANDVDNYLSGAAMMYFCSPTLASWNQSDTSNTLLYIH